MKAAVNSRLSAPFELQQQGRGMVTAYIDSIDMTQDGKLGNAEHLAHGFVAHSHYQRG